MLFESPIILAYCIVVVALLGLCMGSFLNCLAWRTTHDESVLHGRSHCTTCGHVLGVRDLVPLFSWLSTRGTCRYCGKKVSMRYPLTEVLCAIVYVSLLLRYGLTLQTIELMAFASVLLVLSLTDWDDYIIPNATIVACIAIRLAYLVVQGTLDHQPVLALIGTSVVDGLVVGVPVLLLSLIMDHVLGRDSLGGGDVKLLFVAGMYFGWQQSLFLIVVACVLGIVLGMASSSGEEGHLIPFGPAIAIACWITMLVGPSVVGWYTSLF